MRIRIRAGAIWRIAGAKHWCSLLPEDEILKLIKDDMKAGYDLKIHEFTEYQTPNNLLLHEELDGNMIQQILPRSI